jgi:hypothetical protein
MEQARLGHNRGPAYWAEKISARWQDAVQSIIDTGLLLIEAKDALDHGEWGEMFKPGAKPRLPFGQSTANKLVKIADHKVVSDSEHVPNLPPAWGTLYELTKLPEPDLREMLRDGYITCETKRSEAIRLVNKVRWEGAYIYGRVPAALEALMRLMRENWPDPDDMEPSELERMLDSDLWHYNDKELSNLIAWLTKLRAALQKQDEQEQALLAGLKQKEGDGEKLTANERAWMAKLDPRT